MESNLLKDTQYSSEVYSYEDSYGISSDNETEKIEKQMITNRNHSKISKNIKSNKKNVRL